MSIQKPVAWCREPDKYGRRKLSFEKPTGITASTWHPLYTLPGAQPAPSVPDGWQLVPCRMTDAMLRAARDAWLDDPMRRTTTMWEAALAAAPKPEAKP
jgi:hypothetical protein